MFSIFKEQFKKSKYVCVNDDAIVFNPQYDRLMLLLSAILIPIACSYFYYLQSGHKYVQFEIVQKISENTLPQELYNVELVTANKPAAFVKNQAISSTIIELISYNNTLTAKELVNETQEFSMQYIQTPVSEQRLNGEESNESSQQLISIEKQLYEELTIAASMESEKPLETKKQTKENISRESSNETDPDSRFSNNSIRQLVGILNE